MSLLVLFNQASAGALVTANLNVTEQSDGVSSLAQAAVEAYPTSRNLIPNSTFTGATGSTFPSTVTGSGSSDITVSVVGTGFEGDDRYIDVRWLGTGVTTSYPHLNFFFPENLLGPRAGKGNPYAARVEVQLISGALPPGNIALSVRNSTPSAGYLGENSVSIAPTGSPATYTNVGNIASTGTARSGLYLYSVATPGLSVNFTLRVKRPQLERSATLSAYLPTYGTAAGLEEAADTVSSQAQVAVRAANDSRNRFANSANIGGSGWGVSSVTISPQPNGAPNGVDTAYLVTCTGVSNSFVSSSPSLLYPVGTTITRSVDAKAGTSNFLLIERGDQLWGGASFNLTTGVVTNGSGVTGSTENLGGGWWRCKATYTTLTVANGGFAGIYVGAYGTGAAGLSVYLANPQEVIGASVPAYLPTYGTAAGIEEAADTVSSQAQAAIYAFPQSRNLVPNSAFVGASVGVFPTLTIPTYTSGMVVSVVGVGTSAGGDPYIDVRWSGTATALTYPGLYFDNTSSGPLAAVGTAVTAGVDLQVLSGSVSNLQLSIRQTTLAGGYAGSLDQGAAPTGTDARITFTRTLVVAAGATPARTAFAIFKTTALNEVVDFTLRIKRPQLERAATLSAYLPTYGTPTGVEEAADTVSSQVGALVHAHAKPANLFSNSANLAAASWNNNSNISQSPVTGPDGKPAFRIDYNGTADPMLGQNGLSTGDSLSGRTFTIQAEIWTDAGQSTDLQLLIYNSGITDVGQVFRTITTTPTLYSFTKTFLPGTTGSTFTARFDPRDAAGAAGYIYVRYPQISENSTATTYTETTGVQAGVVEASDTVSAQVGVTAGATVASRNLIPNSEFEGVAVGVFGSGGALPTSWTQVFGAGVSYAITEVGVLPSGRRYFDYRMYGTNTSGAMIHNDVILNPAGLPTSIGGQRVFSAYLGTVAGTMTGSGSLNLSLSEYNGSSWLAHSTADFGASPTRLAASRTASSGTVTNVKALLSIKINAGATLDVTIRISAPQLEVGLTETEYRQTYNTGGLSEAPDATAALAAVPAGATLSVTEAADSGSALASVAVRAIGSVAEASDTLSATVQSALAVATGNLEVTEAPDTVGATAQLPVESSLSVQQAGDTLSAQAGVVARATLASTQESDTISAFAQAVVGGTLNLTEAGDTLETFTFIGEIIYDRGVSINRNARVWVASAPSKGWGSTRSARAWDSGDSSRTWAQARKPRGWSASEK